MLINIHTVRHGRACYFKFFPTALPILEPWRLNPKSLRYMPPGRTPARHSTLDVDFAMDKQPPPQPGENFNVVIIGAGGINFGSLEGGPWNHSFRLEHKV